MVQEDAVVAQIVIEAPLATAYLINLFPSPDEERERERDHLLSS